MIENPNIFKLLTGIVCCLVSALSAYLMFTFDKDSFELFWLLPGYIFGLAITIPNVNSIEGTGWKIVSIIFFPYLTMAIYFLNTMISFALLSIKLIELTASLMIIGMMSSILVFWLFNFFYSRKIKILNYFIVTVLGAISFLLVRNFIGDEGIGNHLNVLIYIWQPLVGLGISLSFKKEKIHVLKSIF